MKEKMAVVTLVTFMSAFAYAGTAEVRQAVGCGIAKSAIKFKIEYAAPLDGFTMLTPGIDGETNFILTNIELVAGKKYCIKGNYTVSPNVSPGELESIEAFPQH